MARPTRRTWQLGIDEAWHVLKNGAPFRIKLRTRTQLKLLAIFLLPMVRRPSASTRPHALPEGVSACLTTACALIARGS
jgi:hypothetical protein